VIVWITARRIWRFGWGIIREEPRKPTARPAPVSGTNTLGSLCWGRGLSGRNGRCVVALRDPVRPRQEP
jgi:hypothetical protein